MGYGCPVCDEPQRDAEHLANHLAFQAMVHGDDHETWLDEHAPDWSEGGPADLAPRVAALAPEAEYEVVFEDTVERDDGGQVYDPDLQGTPMADDAGQNQGHGHDHTHGHDHDHTHGHDRPGRQPARGVVDTGSLDPEAREVVEEARELTREMLDDEGTADERTTDEGAEADGEDADAESDE